MMVRRNRPPDDERPQLQRTASMDGSPNPAAVFFQYSDNGVVWGTAGFANVSLTNDVPTWYDLSGALL